MSRGLAWTFACLLLLGGAGGGQPSQASEQAGPAPSGLPVSLPLRRDPPDLAPSFAWAPLAALLAAAGVAGIWLARQRWKAGAKTRVDAAREEALTRLSSQALTSQASLHVVRWNGEELLVACTSQQVMLLSRRTLHLPESHS